VHYIAGLVVGDETLRWQVLAQFGLDEQLGATITISTRHKSSFKAAQDLAAILKANSVKWLRPTSQGNWLFNSTVFKEKFPEYAGDAWLTGDLLLTMDHDYEVVTVNSDGFEYEEARYHCQFVITQALVEDQMPQKIFLSHKGADKPMVRRYKATLEAVGLKPWLDEDAMLAGTELERALLQGFKDSCAAVFFITPRYRDEGYLATEINYALAERRAKLERFHIITLVIPDDDGGVGIVPDLLRPYIYKLPLSELEGFCEIVRALPIAVGPATWRR
jgi:hypothetical protein